MKRQFAMEHRRHGNKEKETVKLRELLQYNLKNVRSDLLPEDCQRFWEYTCPLWAEKFLAQWCSRLTVLENTACP
jgi:hypothetical protein